MPIGEIDPVIYGSLPGYIVSGYQTSSTTLSSGGVNAGDAQEFYIIEQGLDIDYVRKRGFSDFQSETSSYSLSGASVISFNQTTPIAGTNLYCRVKAYSKGYRAFLNFSGQHVQSQLFAVYPNQSDVYGQSYGPVSAGSGILSSVKLGPGGIVRTIQPGYQRYFWSAVSGYPASSNMFPASGWNQSLDAYTFVISMDDCWPKVVTLASGGLSGASNVNVPFLSGLQVSLYTGSPVGGSQYKKESQLLYNPMYTDWPIYNDYKFSDYKTSPSQAGGLNWMYGNYNTSNEPNIAARTLISDIATRITTPISYSTQYPGSVLSKVCSLTNSELYWNQDIQIVYGVTNGQYYSWSISAPVLDKYRAYLHSV